jgi:ArsR family transcriptional regulator, virulence genes transcriptional regulator
MSTEVIDPEKLECMSNRLKAIAHPVRITIIDLLQKNGKLTVGAIQKYLKIEQAATSNHLRILKDQQIIVSTRDGKNKFYSLRQAKLASIIKCIEQCAE